MGERSLKESVVLALLAEEPTHGFALARQLQAGSDLGRVLTVHRPLVYRALDALVLAGLAEAVHVEPGDAGPNRVLHQATAAGKAERDHWLDQPVGHIRDLRIEFLIKLRLNQRAGRDARALVRAQQAALADRFDQLVDEDSDSGPTTRDEGDVVDLWRHHNALAAAAFLRNLSDLTE